MKYRLIIFDMDGTILNTLDDLKNCLNYALDKNDYPVRSMDEVRNFVGNGIHKLIERGVPENTTDHDIERVFDDFNIYYKEHCMDLTKPYDGVVELLGRLRERGYLTAVVSNKLDFAVQELVDRFFKGLFNIAVGEKSGVPKKPAPDSVFNIMNELSVDKSQTVYIGDSEVDLATAENAGIDSIIVEWGFRDREFLEGRGAKTFASTPDCVYRILESE